MTVVMEKKYILKLYDDTIIDFKLISKDIFEELLRRENWTEYTEHLTDKCSMPLLRAYKNKSEYLAIIRDNNSTGYAIYCTNEIFFHLLEKNILIFFSNSESDLSSLSYMLIASEAEVETIKKKHRMNQFSNPKAEEKYYELDDGRYMIVFNDGVAEVFMNINDMKIMDEITG